MTPVKSFINLCVRCFVDYCHSEAHETGQGLDTFHHKKKKYIFALLTLLYMN